MAAQNFWIHKHSFSEVERIHCGPAGDDLKLGAKTTACRELREESGLVLDTVQMEELIDLPEKEGEDWKPLGVMDECWIDMASILKLCACAFVYIQDTIVW